MKTLPGMKILPDTDHHYMFMCMDRFMTTQSLLDMVNNFLNHETFKHVKDRCISREIIDSEHTKIILFGKEIEDFGDFIDIVLICCDKDIMNSIHHDRNLLHDDEIGKVTIKRFYNEQNIDGTSDCIMCIDYGDELESMRNQLSRYSVGETLNEKSV